MRRQTAQSLLEVIFGIVVLIPVVFVFLDLGIILLAVQQNETTCRNAVRAAASGAPAEAARRAKAIVDGSNIRSGGGIVSQFVLVPPVDVKVTSKPISQVDAGTGSQITAGGPILGTAQVTTEVEVRPFIVHLVCGGGQPLKFKVQHSCPLSYVLPASSRSAESPYVAPLLQ